MKRNVLMILVILMMGCCFASAQSKKEKAKIEEKMTQLRERKAEYEKNKKAAAEAYLRDRKVSPEVAQGLRDGYLVLGMTEEEFMLACDSRGKVNVTEGASGRREQWVYGSPGNSIYIYFENGKVTSWQDQTDDPGKITGEKLNSLQVMTLLKSMR